ncbi:zinc finger, C2H2 type [Dictyocaulus viviparus]|uniref:Zinc finger, C2H2 type n=1 Tax=Dictyocaulus viviparus TaxID=29172 RepID=A0A0D8XBM4_DICVI|nr:zinc finger, C2H2 type [Dictyocaulus viviparus]
MGKTRTPISSPSSSEGKRESEQNCGEDGSTANTVSVIGSSGSITDDDCLRTYANLTSLKEFNSALPTNFQERIITGAFHANGGTLPCFKCQKSLTTACGLIAHIKKCRKPVIERLKLPKFMLVKNASKARRSKSFLKKQPNKTVAVPSLEKLKAEPSTWLHLDEDEKFGVLKTYFPDKVICFSVTSGSNEDGRVDQFRLLDKKTRARYVREGMALNLQLPCLECGRSFTHQYGLIYHIDRCNVGDEKAPWKCPRCACQLTRALSHEHRKKCCYMERGHQPSGSTSTPSLVEELCDVNLKSGKSIIKETSEKAAINGAPKLIKNVSAEEAVNDVSDQKQTFLAPKRRRVGGCKVSVSAGVIPENSTRASITEDGKIRFKFRKADTKGNFVGLAGYSRYLGQVRKSLEQWKKEVAALPYCSPLLEIQPSLWSTTFDTSLLLFSKKESIGFRIFETNKLVDEMNIPESCHRLPALKAVGLENGGETMTVAYCGGPINAIRVAPNSTPNDEEVVAVVTYPCERTLIGNDMRNSEGFVQFWLHSNSEQKSNINTWFILKSNYGLVFDVQWLDRPRSTSHETLIGFIALSTAQGVILIYRLDTTSVPITCDNTQNFPVVDPSPAIVLQQQKVLYDKSGNEISNSYPPPIHAIAWSAKDNAQYIVGVNAAGAAIIWDLQRSLDAPHVLLDPTWSSPVTAAVFINGFEVALSFRERLVRVYDVRSYECSLEENTVRTAGSRVSSQTRLFSGFFAFQSEYFASGDVPTNGVCFICTEAKSHGYFVLPLANRHELMTWDVAASCTNAVVASCGVDGRLLLSANGRLVTFGSTMDYGFSVLRSSLTISRRRVCESEAESLKKLPIKSESLEGTSELTENRKDSPRACPSYTTHEETVQHLWLDISLKPDAQIRRTRLDYSALDLRIESLNCVTTNNLPRAVVFTGGQAGLMFIRPCVIDASQTPVDVDKLFTTKSEPL